MQDSQTYSLLHSIYHKVFFKGKDLSNGMREVENFQITFPNFVRFTSFNSRKFSLSYAKKEFLWYCRRDKFDASIKETASIWADIQQPDGSFFSNYGEYLFNAPGVKWVIECLIRDPLSRQAIIPLLNSDCLFQENKDVICTNSIGFRIRDGKLNMSVSMRSQDVIFGWTNDLFCFSLIHELILRILQKSISKLRLGDYNHQVWSFHVYPRHLEMLKKLATKGAQDYHDISSPKMSYSDAQDILNFNLNSTSNWFNWIKDTCDDDYKIKDH